MGPKPFYYQRFKMEVLHEKQSVTMMEIFNAITPSQKYLLVLLGTLLLCSPLASFDLRPNIILVMVDDFGHECVESYGGESYETPQLSRMAKEGVQFNNAHAQNICTPSRVKIMTGQYNVRNYTRFANLNSSLKTFGNLFKEAGYNTCIVGKWQLGGNASTVKKLGFDEHCLWSIYGVTQGERYVSPRILINGKGQSFPGQYGPDIQQEFAKSFISKNKDNPFFLYYPMTLPHYPFQPTPDSAEWEPSRNPKFSNSSFFEDMVMYLDKLVGDLIDHTIQEEISKNTLIIFTSDNGTDHRIVSFQNGTKVHGAKGKMTSDATKVPFIVRWPSVIERPFNSDSLIDFSDLFATFIDIVNLPVDEMGIETLDGKSFAPILFNKNHEIRDHNFCWYMERTDSTDIKYFIQNTRYKLHHDGRFIDTKNDRLEKNPINDKELQNSLNLNSLKTYFEEKMDHYISLRPKRIPFKNGVPIKLPGRLELEMYDIGMPGVTYLDTTPGNSNNGFWRRDDVDIISRKGSHILTNTDAGEWLEYSVTTERQKEFTISVNYSTSTTGNISIFVNDQIVADKIRLPIKESSGIVSVKYPRQVSMPKGESIIRILINEGSADIDYIEFF